MTNNGEKKKPCNLPARGIDDWMGRSGWRKPYMERVKWLVEHGLEEKPAKMQAYQEVRIIVREATKDEPKDIEGVDWESLKEKEGSFLDAVSFVLKHLEIPGVLPNDCPSAQAWSLLVWARQNREKFLVEYGRRVMEREAKTSTEEEDHEDMQLIDDIERGLDEYEITAL